MLMMMTMTMTMMMMMLMMMMMMMMMMMRSGMKTKLSWLPRIGDRAVTASSLSGHSLCPASHEL